MTIGKRLQLTLIGILGAGGCAGFACWRATGVLRIGLVRKS
jgi:transposase